MCTPAEWPRWPMYGPDVIERFRDVLESRRWSPCGFWTGRSTLSRAASAAFAAFNDVSHCVLTSSGSASLHIALEALDIGAGDEVIVPGLTWIAPATAVVNVNAIPVLVDVEPGSCCMSIEAVREAITPRTRAILAVHLYCSMVDLDGLRDVAARHGLAIIEDCAQTHGSRWRGRPAGSLGDIGIFSMTHGKPLTSGEGGAAITQREDLHERLMQLHLDGRRYASVTPALGHMELEEVGGILGTNMAMTDFQATLLLDGLSRIDEQNRQRRTNARILDEGLAAVGGVRPIERPDGVTAQTYYHYFLHYDPDAFAGRSAEAFCRAMEAELGFWVHPSYAPMNRHPLYKPQTKRRYRIDEAHWARLDPGRFHLPVAERIHLRSAVFHHSVLLAPEARMHHIIEAVEKLRREADSIPPA